MFARKALATTLLAASLVAGGASGALASEVPPTRSPAETACRMAEHRIDALHDLQDRLSTKVERLTAARARAAADGRTRLVERIDAALARLGETQDRLTQRIDQLTARMEEYCTPLPVGQG